MEENALKYSQITNLAFGFDGEDASNEWLEPVTDEGYNNLLGNIKVVNRCDPTHLKDTS